MAESRKAGIHGDITMEEYIADPCPEPSLSTTTVQLLLERSPHHAWWWHPRLGANREDDSTRAELGSAVHAALFGGAEVVYAPEDFHDWRKGDARAFRDKARAIGQLPLLAHQRQQIEDMVGLAEQRIMGLVGQLPLYEHTLLWHDAVWGRSRPDILSRDRELLIDYKTSTNAAPPTWIRTTLLGGGYHLQAGLALWGLNALEGESKRAPGREFLFLVQEIDPPYALSVVALGPDLLEVANKQIDRASRMWSECMSAGEFPSYASDIHYAEAPTWLVMQTEMGS